MLCVPSQIVIFAIGHASDDATGLAAVALGGMFCIVTGLAPAFGMATAADTLSSQAFGRDPKSPLVGIILQQSILILGVLGIPIAIVWANAEAILLLCGQDPEVAYLAGTYCRLLLPGLPAVLIFESLKKYTQAQGQQRRARRVRAGEGADEEVGGDEEEGADEEEGGAGKGGKGGKGGYEE